MAMTMFESYDGPFILSNQCAPMRSTGISSRPDAIIVTMAASEQSGSVHRFPFMFAFHCSAAVVSMVTIMIVSMVRDTMGASRQTADLCVRGSLDGRPLG
jgi:hypothetical protein